MDNDKGNSNKNTSGKDEFQKMLALAEFGVKRMEERRNFEFKIFISYITLLVLALYQLLKPDPISLKSLIAIIGQEPTPFISSTELTVDWKGNSFLCVSRGDADLGAYRWSAMAILLYLRTGGLGGPPGLCVRSQG